MHKFSRTLLLAGVLAFGTLSAACGDKVVTNPAPTGVSSVTVTPTQATIPASTSIQLALSVNADASTAKTVAWTTSDASIATVDGTGKVTATAKGGVVTITATATADPSKAAASVITVTAVTAIQPSIAINGVTQNGVSVNLANTAGQIDVTVNTSGGGLIEVFLSQACTSNSIGAADKVVASQTATSAQPGTVTLSFNTAQLNNGAPAFPNGAYCIKTRLTSGAQTFVATNTVPITLNNANVFTGTLAFASAPQNAPGSPTSAVSTINGLNYNQGTLTATINPVIFTSSSPVALITGYLTHSGEQAGVLQPAGTKLAFTNAAVASGVATIVFPDTAGAPALSIYQYTSLPGGDSLVITSATDAAGNPIAVPAPVTVASGAGIRIDNNMPSANGATFSVLAPNGYIPAAYLFSAGTDTTGGSPTDIHASVPGVGGVTITYYVGASNSAAFTTPNSCDITGLTAATNASALNNTNNTNADQAKVVIKDALGNQTCLDAPSTLVGGNGFFGVDKIAPEVAYTTATVNGLLPTADQTGYNAATGAARGWNLTFRDSISGFPQTPGSSPFTGTLTRILSTAPTSLDCVIGVWNGTTKVCSPAPVNTTTAPSWVEQATVPASSFLNGTFQYTNGTNVVGYYLLKLTESDVAGNTTALAPRTAAFDNVAPGVAAPTASAPAVPLSSVTVTAAATDNFDLISSKGNLVYTGLVTFASVSGNTLGAFGQFVTSATASVALPNVYRGIQDASTGTISATVVTPSATVTVTDVGGNSTTSTAGAIATTTPDTAFAFVAPPSGAQVSFTSSAANGTAGASVATTNLTFQINGPSSNAAFQSQPFSAVDIYKLNSSGQYALVTTVTAPTVVDNTTTGVRTYTYAATGVALTAGPAATNTFIAIAHNASGDAVLSPSVTQTNP